MYGPSNGQWNFLLIMFLVGITFGIWKIIELLIWVFKHMHWS